MSYYQQRRRSTPGIGEEGNSLVMLIAVQLAVFIVFAFIKVIYYFSYAKEGLGLYRQQVLNWFTLPADLSELIVKPWTLITHFFLHDDVWHILPNMLWLWAFGYILQDLSGNRKLVPIFIYGALAGAVAFLLAYNLIPALRVNVEYATALGASAGVMAIAIATTVLAPGYRIFPLINGGIPIWVITLIYVIIDIATIPYNNPGGHIAHLAGAAMGFLFIFMMQRGHDWSGWMNQFFDWVNNLFNPDKPKKGKGVKNELFYKNQNVPPYKVTNTNVTQQRVDEILDKINQKGYHTLTTEEKEILRRASSDDQK